MFAMSVFSFSCLSDLFETIGNAQDLMWDQVDAGTMSDFEVDYFAFKVCRKNNVRWEQYQDWLSFDTGSREEILNYTEADMERLYDWLLVDKPT